MEKERVLRRMITELQAYVLNATQNSIKAKTSAKRRDWNYGKKRTGELLPNYSRRGCYIPEFTNMTIESYTLQNLIHDART